MLDCTVQAEILLLQEELKTRHVCKTPSFAVSSGVTQPKSQGSQDCCHLKVLNLKNMHAKHCNLYIFIVTERLAIVERVQD